MQAFSLCIVFDVLSVGREQGWFKPTYASSYKDLKRIIMHVKRAALHTMRSSLPKDDTDTLFDGVESVKSCIPIDTEE